MAKAMKCVAEMLPKRGAAAELESTGDSSPMGHNQIGGNCIRPYTAISQWILDLIQLQDVLN